jgi:hypothetical protein
VSFQPIPVANDFPPLGAWKWCYLGGHLQTWVPGRLADPLTWELDHAGRRIECPDFIEVARMLVTHWSDEPPGPEDWKAAGMIGRVVDALPAPPRHLPDR